MLVTNATVLPLIAHRRLTSENERMRFWIGLFLGLVIGAAGTIAYYEVWDTGVVDEEQVSEPVTQGGR